MYILQERVKRTTGLELSGWQALVGVAAFVVVVSVGAVYAYRRYKGLPTHSTTVVLKSRAQYARVATSE
jgi:hypothetical protein